MYEQVEKPKENKSRAVADSVSQWKRNDKQGVVFVDRRPEVIVQRKLQNVIRNGTQNEQTTHLQTKTDSDSVVRLEMHSSQHQPIQRNREAGYYGRDGKKKSQRVIRMEEFGDRNRIHNLDPNKLGETLEEDVPGMEIDKDNDINKETGIWRPSKEEETARPEDPPIYQPFRKAFHNTHNILLSMKRDMKGFDELDPKKKYTTRLLKIASDVKQQSVKYKSLVRSFKSETPVEELKNPYFMCIRELTFQVEELGTEMINAYKEGNEEFEDFETKEIEELKTEDGEKIWKKKWWAAVQEVNRIIGTNWQTGKDEIKNWVKTKKEEGLPYMNGDMVGDLDYIGSLAKGYKSAPKQYLRFLPEMFDVDANLDAPPLAVYSIKKGEVVDRGSVKGKEISPLSKFETEVWKQLLEVPGIDANDQFEVFIRADNVSDLMSGVKGDEDNAVGDAQKEEAFSTRFQAIQNRIWWLRSKDVKFIKILNEKLKKYITEDGLLKIRVLSDAKINEYAYTETDLTVMELRLKKMEKIV